MIFKKIYLLISLFILILVSTNCIAQNTDPWKSKFGLGIAISPSYDDFNQLYLNLYFPRITLKEYQILLGGNIQSLSDFYRIELGVNWYLTERNVERKLQLFPSTSVSYSHIVHENQGSNPPYLTREAFVSLGINLNYNFYKNIFLTGRTQLGWGQQWVNSQEISLPGGNNAVFNIFYYVGFKILFNHSKKSE